MCENFVQTKNYSIETSCYGKKIYACQFETIDSGGRGNREESVYAFDCAPSEEKVSSIPCRLHNVIEYY